MIEYQQREPAQAIALAWQPRPSRPALAALFDLDRRLATVVAGAKEPMLAQVRLAWWRERLADISSPITATEPLLSELALQWGGHAARLTSLVDGWELLLGDAPLGDAAISGLADERGRALAAFAEVAGAPTQAFAASAAGRCWAFADIGTRSSDVRERELARSLGRAERQLPIRSRHLRGLAVLGGLSRLAIKRGEPLMGGRRAALTAMRLGLFGD